MLALVALALGVMSFVGVVVFSNHLQNQVDVQLESVFQQASDPRDLIGGRELFAENNSVIIEVLDSDGTPAQGIGNWQIVTIPPPSLAPSQLVTHTSPFTVPAQQGSSDWRVITESVRYSLDGGLTYQYGTLVAGVSLGNLNQSITYLTRLDILVSLGILLVLLAVGYAVVRANLQPLVEIEETAEEIAAGHLDRRVPVRDARTEVGSLGRSLNTMLGHIEEAFRDREESEAAAHQSEERMRRFIADASHELRTPLTAIRGFAEYYRQRGGISSDGGLTPEDLERIMQRVEGEAARMGVLVEDLLLLARLDQQRPLQHRPVDLLTLAADAVHDARLIAPARAIDLRVQPGAAFLVIGDEARLRQVIGNLMSNALTHTPDGTAIMVSISSGRLPTGDPAAFLDVKDNGPGMPPEQAQRVFERFYRADQARNRATGGSGLGLAIVAALVAAHGGTTEVMTTPGQGATFRVALPLEPQALGGDEDDEPEADEPEADEQGAETLRY
jgi:two-component system, OmpR family, sensor kinase